MPPKKMVGLSLSPETLERLRDAAFWTEGETVSSLAEKGALAYVDWLEAERGAPFPKREGEVKTGRPRKA